MDLRLRPVLGGRLQAKAVLGHPGGSRVTNLRHGVVLEANQVSHGRRLDHTRLRIGSPAPPFFLSLGYWDARVAPSDP
jgi:hypothetical protein